MKQNTIILIGFILFLSCRNEKGGSDKTVERIELPNEVIQVFVNDGNKDEKLSKMDFNYLVENFVVGNVDTLNDDIVVVEYIVPPECGGCFSYSILTLNKNELYAMPINLDYWFNIYNYFTNDTLKECEERYKTYILNHIELVSSGINYFFKKQCAELPISKKVDLARVILADFVFDGTIKEKVVELNININDYGISESMLKNEMKDYYWLNGAVVVVDWNSSTEKFIISFQEINFDQFSSVRY